MKYVLVMLEPLEARYTKQRDKRITEELAGKVNVMFVYGETMGAIEADKISTQGDVLDVYNTNYWKASQLKMLMELIQGGEIDDNTTIWFADLWFPGIEMLAYIRSITGKKFKISGVLHAGTRDKMDFTNRYHMGERAKGFERTIIQLADKIYLGSEYHQKMIYTELAEAYGVTEGRKFLEKTEVTGLFFDADEVRDSVRGLETEKKENLIVFPHRIAPEKFPDKFDDIASEYNQDDWSFVKTMEVTKNKQEYYELLATADKMVSFEGQETFGYAVLECMALGVIPLVYDGMSYKETVPAKYRRKTTEELHAKLRTKYTTVDRKEVMERASRFRPNVLVSKMFS